MKVINATSVSDALAEALHGLVSVGVTEPSRNGDVIAYPYPVATVYHNPLRRVLFSPLRNANPFFHFFESLWMLAGRNDVHFVAQFAKNLRTYSDDGNTLWGAYGYRWKFFFGYDQLNAVITELHRNPESRRAVLSMWNAMPLFDRQDDAVVLSDSVVAANGGKDVPCNTHAYFDLRGGRLNMTVCNRSNDAIWGAYGANAVHFSFLQQYIASALHVPVGTYTQFSNNLHVYVDVVQSMTSGGINGLLELARDVENSDGYNPATSFSRLYRNVPEFGSDPVENLFHGINGGDHVLHRTLFDEDLNTFFTAPDSLEYFYNTWFFAKVVSPMYMAHKEYREKKYDLAGAWVEKIEAWDWKLAASQWLLRRHMERSKYPEATIYAR